MEENLDVHVYGAVTVEWSQAARNVFSDPASLVIWGLASLYVHLGCRAALLKHTLLINNKGGEMGDEDCKNCIHTEFTEYAGVMFTRRRCAPVRLAGPQVAAEENVLWDFTAHLKTYYSGVYR